MVTVVRVGRVLVLIALTFVAIALVIGVGTSSTGPLEKGVLLALVGVSVFAAAKVTTLTERIVHRLQG